MANYQTKMFKICFLGHAMTVKLVGNDFIIFLHMELNNGLEFVESQVAQIVLSAMKTKQELICMTDIETLESK